MIPHLAGASSPAASFLLVWVAAGACASETPVYGAGATFPAPIYSSWAVEYRRATGDEVRYEALGSGIGIERLKNHKVDFGATDYPLSSGDLQGGQLLQFPAIIGGVVPVVNINGIESGALKLSGRVLGNIYLGKITRWDDPAIAKLNPAIKLPRQNITVVHRSDSSGTTYLWSGYLSGSHAEWREKFGTHPDLIWPVGVGGVGNEGVASYVQRTRASLGYVEYTYARQHHLSYVSVDNGQGGFLLPSRQSFESAARSAHWDKVRGQYEVAGASQGAEWPITGASYILVRAPPNSPAEAHAVLEFFSWAFAHGAPIAKSLDYVSLPDAVIGDIESAWEEKFRDAGGRPVWTRRRGLHFGEPSKEM
jgi:phosphate transport system substrate-binding protein